VWKRISERVNCVCRFPQHTFSARTGIRLQKAYQAVIACISGRALRIFIASLVLYASTFKLISVRTFGNVLVRKCVARIQGLSVP
jgi:hypothetical protein